MSELKSVYIDRTGDWCRSGNDTGKFYLKEEADKVIKEKDNEIARLDDLAHAHNIELLRKENLIAEVKAKLESVQATAYAESVDAGMENRKLKRAMWLARAERADDRARIFYFNDLETKLDIDGYSYDRKKKKGHKKLTARLWRIIWLKVELKCRAKAEKYK